MRVVLAAAATALVSALVACRPEIVVLLETRLYPDGGVDRVVEVIGRTEDGEIPDEAGWITDTARLDLADPGGWDRVERNPDRIRAEGFFPPGAAIPGTLLHLDGANTAADRSRVDVAVEDMVILSRWIYRETYGDPYGRDAAVRAVDGLLDLAAEAIERELRAAFADRADTEGAVRRLRTDGRALALEVLEAYRLAPGPERRAQREALLESILARRGISPAGTGDSSFWESFAPSLRDWVARSLAEAASTQDDPIVPSDLSFLPVDLADESAWGDVVVRTWGGDEQLWERARPWVETLQGYYGGEQSARYRFRARVTLPGILVSTNGTPVPGGAEWFFRGEDLHVEDRVLQAESLEPNDRALVSLGARRIFETVDLLAIRDLLVNRDPRGLLRLELAAAVAEGDLDRLRDLEKLADEVESRAFELADRLDPAVPRIGSGP